MGGNPWAKRVLQEDESPKIKVRAKDWRQKSSNRQDYKGMIKILEKRGEPRNYKNITFQQFQELL